MTVLPVGVMSLRLQFMNVAQHFLGHFLDFFFFFFYHYCLCLCQRSMLPPRFVMLCACLLLRNQTAVRLFLTVPWNQNPFRILEIISNNHIFKYEATQPGTTVPRKAEGDSMLWFRVSPTLN